ncbi:hypothetical protein LTR86_002496 [Recurvomyces mirabilis]|nr:hypothetical protein LTR86_002496 [Recurvomyces mirabilis]
MAALYAGLKRNHDHMLDLRHSVSEATSRDLSPYDREERPTNTPRATLDRSGLHGDVSEDSASFRTFDASSSIVLIGVRGAGKSSLGVLAATAYSRRLVEIDRSFFDTTGITPRDYRKTRGAEEFYKRHASVLAHTLNTHNTNSVIICGFADLEHDGATLLRTYAKTHPVFHVTRDAMGIQSYLQVWSVDRVQRLLRDTGPLLRSCTNFEFFNLTELLAAPAEQGVPDVTRSDGLFLTLKRVERDFLRLLRNVLGDRDRIPSHQSAYPLSQIFVHERPSTICTQVDLEDIVRRTADLDDIQVGADAIEILIAMSTSDHGPPHEDLLLSIAEAFAVVRRSTIIPIILTVAPAQRDGELKQQYMCLTSYCLRFGPEYVTVALPPNGDTVNVRALLGGKGRTIMIGECDMDSRPKNGWLDEECLKLYCRGDSLGFDIVRVRMPADSTDDNFGIPIFLDRANRLRLRPLLTAYNTGKHGRTSLCFNKILTPVTAPGSHNSMTARGKIAITAPDIFSALFATFVYEPLHFFIYGASVDFSLSPVMHNAAYRACGMQHTYSKHSSPDLKDFEMLCQQPDFGGAAVVQPYKTGVLPLLKGLSSHAKAIGAVNTILPVREFVQDSRMPTSTQLLLQANKSGPVKALYGDNTDWIGMRACLRRGLSPANTVRPHSTALICGAGGQARSAVYAMLSLGVRTVFVCNRNADHAHELARHYNSLLKDQSVGVVDPAESGKYRVRVLNSFASTWPKDARHPSMILSSIPTQAADGSPTNFTLPADWLKSPTGGVLVELAYRPMVTPIVKQVRALAHKGWILMDGFDVLPEQAFAQFELFTGRRAPRKVMRDEVLRRYREEQQSMSAACNLDPNPPAS